MTGRLDPPLAPRSGRTLRVVLVCRISTDHQDVKSLDDQEALLRTYVAACFAGPVEFRIIASRQSGQYLDREELLELERLIEDRRYDLVIAEDLARICRRVRAYEICEMAVDSDTRLIALNDHVDTAREDWHLGAFFSTLRHESYCRDTSKRIRRSLRNRFAQGGVVQTLVYGYIKPPGAESDADVRKDPEAEPVYNEWFRKLEDGATYAEVADWLNDKGIPTGPASRSTSWNVARVRNVTLNPILKGDRVRNRMIARRINKTGRSRSVPAPPEELQVRHVDHLAFVDPERYDRIIALIRRRNGKYKAKGLDGRKGVPRKRTTFPGQHLACGVCGRVYYFGGNGQADQLMCSGAREHRCWNGMAVDARIATEKIAKAVLAELDGMPEFDKALRDQVNEEVRAAEADRGRDVEGLRGELEEVRKKLDRILELTEKTGHTPTIVERLLVLETERDRLGLELAERERAPRQPMELPNIERLRVLAVEAFKDLLAGSPEAARLAQRLLPRLEVIPYRIVDAEAVEPRAHMTLDLTALVPEARALEGRLGPLKRELVVDLFDMPQRAAFREQILALRAGGLSEKEVAARLGLTITAAQRAASLDRLMKQQGLTDPYMRMTEPPEDSKRSRRHRNPRYRFEPLAGWTPWPGAGTGPSQSSS